MAQYVNSFRVLLLFAYIYSLISFRDRIWNLQSPRYYRLRFENNWYICPFKKTLCQDSTRSVLWEATMIYLFVLLKQLKPLDDLLLSRWIFEIRSRLKYHFRLIKLLFCYVDWFSTLVEKIYILYFVMYLLLYFIFLKIIIFIASSCFRNCWLLMQHWNCCS